jgi:DNA-directed RNA polymerase subunit M/transcription elongation factor TFIIS
MDSFEEFTKQIDIYFNQIVKKKKNRQRIAEILWKCSNNDISMANFLCFEILSEYYCSFRLADSFHNLKKKNIGWNHDSFKVFKKKQKEIDEFLTKEPEIEEGVIECKSCGSKKTFSFSKQTRRADESATVFVRCSQCSKTFKM